jgi:hypothetical protein
MWVPKWEKHLHYFGAIVQLNLCRSPEIRKFEGNQAIAYHWRSTKTISSHLDENYECSRCWTMLTLNKTVWMLRNMYDHHDHDKIMQHRSIAMGNSHILASWNKLTKPWYDIPTSNIVRWFDHEIGLLKHIIVLVAGEWFWWCKYLSHEQFPFHPSHIVIDATR